MIVENDAIILENDSKYSKLITNTTVLPEAETTEEPITDKVTADIIFNQYIYRNDKNIIRPSNYSFYDENTGFSHFSDMFK